MGIFDFFLTQCKVPIAEFRERCRVPIERGKVNRWLLLRGFESSDVLDPEDLRRDAAELVTEALGGAVGEVRVRVPRPGEPVEDMLAGLTAALNRLQACPFPMTTAGDAFIGILVEFKPTSAAPETVPWVAQQRSALTADEVFKPEDCPTFAEWILDRTMTPTDAFELSEEEKPEPGLLERAKETVTEQVEKVQAAYAVAALVALVLGAAYVFGGKR